MRVDPDRGKSAFIQCNNARKRLSKEKSPFESPGITRIESTPQTSSVKLVSATSAESGGAEAQKEKAQRIDKPTTADASGA